MRALLVVLAMLAAGCSLAGSSPGAPLLIVREYDWLNATSERHEPIGGDFGGHCAPVDYHESPPTLRIYDGGPSPKVPRAALVRDFRDSPRVELAVTTSADRIAYEPLENSTPLGSPFELPNGTFDLAKISHSADADAFIVDGVTVAPGSALHTHVEYDFDERGASYHAAHELVFANAGRAAVSFVQRGGACM